MNYIIILIILLIIFILFIIIYNTIYKKTYSGLVLFDIDGTLSDGTENYAVVQYFLDRNYTVGISTAGSIYTPNNIKNYKWMPTNLYNFMLKHNFDTFNNVSSNIICGKYNQNIYNTETVINFRFDILDNSNTFEKDKIYTFIKNNKNHTFTKNIFMFDYECNGIDNIYIGNTYTMYKLANTFYYNLDDILSKNTNTIHQERLVYRINLLLFTL